MDDGGRGDGIAARRRWVWPAAAAAAILVLTGIPAALARHDAHRAAHPQPPLTLPYAAHAVSTPSVVDGRREWSYHGLAIRVPAGWPRNALQCADPVRDTVLYPGPRASCLGGRPPGITVLDFGGADFTLARSVPTRAVAISGVAATRREGPVGDGAQRLWLVSITVPSYGASAVVTSPTRRLADAIAATARLLRTSPEGCPEHAAHVDLDHAAPPAQDGARDTLIPGRPRSLLFCRYVSGGLEQATPLPAARLGVVVDALNALPPGLSRTARNAYPTTCEHPGTAFDTSDVVVHVAYPHSVLLLHARLGYCGALGITNGARTGRRTDALVTVLTRIAGVDAYPMHVLP